MKTKKIPKNAVYEIVDIPIRDTCPKCEIGRQSPCEYCNFLWNFQYRKFIVKLNKR